MTIDTDTLPVTPAEDEAWAVIERIAQRLRDGGYDAAPLRGRTVEEDIGEALARYRQRRKAMAEGH
jgi:hypothetical protein